MEQSQLEELGCRVVMVAHSILQSARTWLESCGFDFPLLVDREQTLYKTLGLGRSVSLWKMPTLIRYVEQVMSGEKLLRSFEGDDLHLMGGDLMVNSSGKLLYTYYGKTTYDRPTVSELLEQLRNFDKAEHHED